MLLGLVVGEILYGVHMLVVKSASWIWVYNRFCG